MKLGRHKIIFISAIAVIVVAITSNISVPLYDGVNFPDEPYRYVDISHRPATRPPDSPSLMFTPQEVRNGLSLISNEQGPQIAVYIDPTAIQLSPGVQSAVIKAQPLASASQPSDSTIDGNIYRISGMATGGTFNITKAGRDTFNSLQMRLPQGSPPSQVFEYRPLNGSAWQKLSTEQVGNDIYETTIDNFGDYALVTLKSSLPSRSGSSAAVARRKLPVIAVFLSALIILMVAAILYIRLKQQKQLER